MTRDEAAAMVNDAFKRAGAVAACSNHDIASIHIDIPGYFSTDLSFQHGAESHAQRKREEARGQTFDSSQGRRDEMARWRLDLINRLVFSPKPK